MASRTPDRHYTDEAADAELLRRIRERAWERNRRRAEDLGEIVAALRGTGSLTADQVQHARSVTHQLIGSAGTFGHAEVTATATRIQALLPREPGRPAGDDVAELSGLVADVSTLLEAEPPGEG